MTTQEIPDENHKSHSDGIQVGNFVLGTTPAGGSITAHSWPQIGVSRGGITYSNTPKKSIHQSTPSWPVGGWSIDSSQEIPSAEVEALEVSLRKTKKRLKKATKALVKAQEAQIALQERVQGLLEQRIAFTEDNERLERENIELRRAASRPDFDLLVQATMPF